MAHSTFEEWSSEKIERLQPDTLVVDPVQNKILILEYTRPSDTVESRLQRVVAGSLANCPGLVEQLEGQLPQGLSTLGAGIVRDRRGGPGGSMEGTHGGKERLSKSWLRLVQVTEGGFPSG
jgi:hypothetical protein